MYVSLCSHVGKDRQRCSSPSGTRQLRQPLNMEIENFKVLSAPAGSWRLDRIDDLSCSRSKWVILMKLVASLCGEGPLTPTVGSRILHATRRHLSALPVTSATYTTFGDHISYFVNDQDDARNLLP